MAINKDNLAHWDEVTPHHVVSPFYRTADFRAGESILDPIVREAVGEYLAGEAGETSFLALAHDLAGSVEGPEDLSTNPEHLADYGR